MQAIAATGRILITPNEILQGDAGGACVASLDHLKVSPLH